MGASFFHLCLAMRAIASCPVFRPARGLTACVLASVAGLWAPLAWAVHFDIELRTDRGPVAGARITTDFYGDLTEWAGNLPIDAETGQKIYPGYFGDLEGGPYLTDDPGFQAFAGTFVRGELVAYRALGTLRWWNPATGRWGAAPQGIEVVLYGNIPIEVEIGYDTDPAAWAEQYAYYSGGTRYHATGVSGPLSAFIDDAKTGGSFHAHLDWKITAPARAAPNVGAYMVTLQFWSSAQAGGQQKYLPSTPVQIIFERGISEAQMRTAIQARIAARPPDAGVRTRVPRAPWASP